MKKQKIVILGGGFGGVYSYLSLRKYLGRNEAEVVFISKTNYFLFTPLLHEVATGGLDDEEVVESIRSISYKTGADVMVADVVGVDTERRVVRTSSGDVSYDYLVVALGGTTNFYNIPGAQEHALVLKDLANAVDIRNRFISTFEEASHIENAETRKKMLSFVVVGGGPTGVELVAEMADLFFNAFRKYYKGHICAGDVSIHLINKGPELLPMFDPVLRARTLSVLRAKGVDVLLNKDVSEVTKQSVRLADGEVIPASHVLWAAGVMPQPLEFDREVERDRGGRIIVDEFLRVKNTDTLFALGDIASYTPDAGMPLPMLAQVAVQQGAIVGKNIAAHIRGQRLSRFTYHSRGSLVSLGKWQAVGKVFGTLWTGPLGWWMWRTVYLFNFASWPKRIKIAVDWTIHLFYPRDITKA